jgi:hypothetical protein
LQTFKRGTSFSKRTVRLWDAEIGTGTTAIGRKAAADDRYVLNRGTG